MLVVLMSFFSKASAKIRDLFGITKQIPNFFALMAHLLRFLSQRRRLP
jgi:hypothetical protein